MPRDQKLVIVVAIVLVFSVAVSGHPRFPSRLLDNNCQCDCCYSIGSQGRTECIPPTATSFSVYSCSLCDVHTCAAHFPTACAQVSSIVNASCIKREGWMLRIVPVAFIIIAVGLVIYGLCVRKFDGYHDDDLLNHPRPRFSQRTSYHTFGATHGVQPPFDGPTRPFLSTIAEERDQTDAAASSSDQPPTSHQKPHPSSQIASGSASNAFDPESGATLAPTIRTQHHSQVEPQCDTSAVQTDGTAETLHTTEEGQTSSANQITPLSGVAKQSDNLAENTSVIEYRQPPQRAPAVEPASDPQAPEKNEGNTITERRRTTGETATVSEIPKSVQVESEAVQLTVSDDSPTLNNSEQSHVPEQTESAVEDNGVTQNALALRTDFTADVLQTEESTPSQAQPENDVAREPNTTADANADIVEAEPPASAVQPEVRESGKQTENLHAEVETGNTIAIGKNSTNGPRTEAPELTEQILTCVERNPEPVSIEESMTLTETQADIEDAVAIQTDKPTVQQDEVTYFEQTKDTDPRPASLENDRDHDAVDVLAVVDEGHPEGTEVESEALDSKLMDLRAQSELIVDTAPQSLMDHIDELKAGDGTVGAQNIGAKKDAEPASNIDAVSEIQNEQGQTHAEGSDQEQKHETVQEANVDSRAHEGSVEDDGDSLEAHDITPQTETAIDVASSGAAEGPEKIEHTIDSELDPGLEIENETQIEVKHQPADTVGEQEHDLQQDHSELPPETKDTTRIEDYIESEDNATEDEAKPQRVQEQDTLPNASAPSTSSGLHVQDDSARENQIHTVKKEPEIAVEVDADETVSKTEFANVAEDKTEPQQVQQQDTPPNASVPSNSIGLHVQDDSVTENQIHTVKEEPENAVEVDADETESETVLVNATADETEPQQLQQQDTPPDATEPSTSSASHIQDDSARENKIHAVEGEPENGVEVDADETESKTVLVNATADETEPQQLQQQDTPPDATEPSTSSALHIQDDSARENQIHAVEGEPEDGVEVDADETDSKTGFAVIKLKTGVSQNTEEESPCLSVSEQNQEQETFVSPEEVIDPMQEGFDDQTTQNEASGLNTVPSMESRAEKPIVTSKGTAETKTSGSEYPAPVLETGDTEQEVNFGDKPIIIIESSTLTTISTQNDDRDPESQSSATIESSPITERTGTTTESEISREIEIASALNVKPKPDAQEESIAAKAIDGEIEDGNEPMEAEDVTHEPSRNGGGPESKTECAAVAQLPTAMELPHESVPEEKDSTHEAAPEDKETTKVDLGEENNPTAGNDSKVEDNVGIAEEDAMRTCTSGPLGTDQDVHVTDVEKASKVIERSPCEQGSSVDIEPSSQVARELEEIAKDIFDINAELAAARTYLEENVNEQGILDFREKTDEMEEHKADSTCTNTTSREH